MLRGVALIGKVDDRGGPARDQAHIEESGVEFDPHGYSLRQPDPAEGRVDVSDQVAGGCALPIENSRRNALHAAVQKLRFAHEPDGDAVTLMKARQLGLFEVAIDMQAVARPRPQARC